MKTKVTTVVISLVMASVFVSGGYGFWEKELTIKGDIKVVPDSETVMQTLGNVVPNTDVDGNSNSATQNSAQISDSQKDLGTSNPEHEQSNTTGSSNESIEQVEQGDAINQTEQIKPSEQVVSTEQAENATEVTEAQSPSPQGAESNKNTSSEQIVESKEQVDLPGNNVGENK